MEGEAIFTYSGIPVRAYVIGAVVQGLNQYCAVMRGYQAPTQTFERHRALLHAIDQSIVITNPTQVAGLDHIQLPQGTSHDAIYGNFNKGYHTRQRSTDIWSKGQREGMMGVERMKDSLTGQFYDEPLEAYDPTRGGYRNPMRPEELLDPAEPGE